MRAAGGWAPTHLCKRTHECTTTTTAVTRNGGIPKRRGPLVCAADELICRPIWRRSLGWRRSFSEQSVQQPGGQQIDGAHLSQPVLAFSRGERGGAGPLAVSLVCCCHDAHSTFPSCVLEGVDFLCQTHGSIQSVFFSAETTRLGVSGSSRVFFPY